MKRRCDTPQRYYDPVKLSSFLGRCLLVEGHPGPCQPHDPTGPHVWKVER